MPWGPQTAPGRFRDRSLEWHRSLTLRNKPHHELSPVLLSLVWKLRPLAVHIRMVLLEEVLGLCASVLAVITKEQSELSNWPGERGVLEINSSSICPQLSNNIWEEYFLKLE